MPEATDQLDATVEEAHMQLHDGLTSCRSVVNDYRALILGVGVSQGDPEINLEARAEAYPKGSGISALPVR